MGWYLTVYSDAKNNPYLLKNIAPIKFSKLKTLSISRNHIESLESFHRLEAPILTSIFCCKHGIIKDDNDVHSIYDLRKISWTLTQLQLSTNTIKKTTTKSLI